MEFWVEKAMIRSYFQTSSPFRWNLVDDFDIIHILVYVPLPNFRAVAIIIIFARGICGKTLIWKHLPFFIKSSIQPVEHSSRLSDLVVRRYSGGISRREAIFLNIIVKRITLISQCDDQWNAGESIFKNLKIVMVTVS